MAKFTDKISLLINSQAPEFVLQDHPKFLEFVKAYYSFMESAELIVEETENTDGIRLETETTTTSSLLLDASRVDTDRTALDTGDKILLEDTTYGKFTRGETITGQSSGVTSTILTEDLDNNKLYIVAQDKFIDGEAIVGSTSNARAIIQNYRPNPVNNIQSLLNFRDPDKVISNFLTKFRNEFLNSLPEDLDDSVDKRKLIKNIKSVYRAKGTARGHEVFFKLLFDENSETRYPRENMLRVSDGKWSTSLIMKAIATTGDTTQLVGRTITGGTSGATAFIEDVRKFQIGSNVVTEFVISTGTLNGTFTIGEQVTGLASDTDDTYIKANVTGVPQSITISNDGVYYNENDSIDITGGGVGAIVQVDGVGRGSITDFVIDDGGSNYEIGDTISFNNANAGGGNASAEVSVVNGGFTQETSDSTVDDHIILEDETVRGDPYTGNKIVQESGSGDITDIRLISGGSNYIALPTVSVTSTSGTGASVYVHGSEIGRLQSIRIVESGSEWEQSPSPPTLDLPVYMIVTDVSGTLTADTTLTSLDSSSTSITGTISSFDTNTNVLKVTDASGTFEEARTITASNGATATIAKVDGGTATVTVGSTIQTAGVYVNQDGHVSETSMRIQDSLYYQDFSYVIKVGRTINDWRDSFKKTMHTSGFYFTGQVNIENSISAQISSPVEGIISGAEESPIMNIIGTLFSTIFGRRLGTEDDGTTLRATPEVGVDPDFTDSTTEHFTPGTRDLTLVRKMTITKEPADIYVTVRGEAQKFGYAYCGPRMKSLNIDTIFGTTNPYGGNNTYTQTAAAGADSTVTTYITPMKMVNWADMRLSGLQNTSLDGEVVQFRDLEVDDLKTYIAHPTEISISY